MTIDTVIFDMDGLLIDSEPSWENAGREMLAKFGVSLTREQHLSTTGLRSKEWIDWWFRQFDIDAGYLAEAEIMLNNFAIDFIRRDAIALPGIDHVFSLFEKNNFRIGLATSSPMALVEVVEEKLQLKGKIHAYMSAENLIHGKPHPEVYLDCARMLRASPLQCVCFEDSVYGMVAAKAARMKCVVIPAAHQLEDKRFGLADLMLPALSNFTQNHLDSIRDMQ